MRRRSPKGIHGIWKKSLTGDQEVRGVCTRGGVRDGEEEALQRRGRMERRKGHHWESPVDEPGNSPAGQAGRCNSARSINILRAAAMGM